MFVKTFAESYLTRLLERRLLLEPQHLYEVSRGLSEAMGEMKDAALPLERLAEAVERMGTENGTAVVNLLNMPLGPLWVRAALQGTKEKLADQKKAIVIIIGLWQVLRGKGGRRTEIVEKSFTQWRGFVEERLMDSQAEELTVMWIG